VSKIRIHIFGASGSGVTTLGNTLSEYLGIPYFDSDDFFWEKTKIPFTSKRDPDKRNQIIKRLLNITPEWIYGGSSWSWGNGIFPEFSLVVFLKMPKEVRMKRLLAREYLRYGDIINTDPIRKQNSDGFFAWASDYDDCTGIAGRNIKVHEAWIEEIQSPILKLDGDLSVNQRVQRIMDEIKNHP
jgi:adenylate kinase family enzyme